MVKQHKLKLFDNGNNNNKKIKKTINQISFFTFYLLIDQSLTTSNLRSNCVNCFSFPMKNRCNSFYLSKHSHSYQLINHNFPKADYRLCCNSSFVTNALQQMSPFLWYIGWRCDKATDSNKIYSRHFV